MIIGTIVILTLITGCCGIQGMRYTLNNGERPEPWIFGKRRQS